MSNEQVKKDNFKFVVGDNFLNPLMDYLVKRPYSEVYQLMDYIRSLQPVNKTPVKENTAESNNGSAEEKTPVTVTEEETPIVNA